MTDDPVFDTSGACQYLGGLHPQTVRRQVALRELACIRRGRRGRLYFRRSHLDAWLKRHEVRAARRVEVDS